jgi:membrane-bound serine protease (ClpP class)
MADVEQLTKSLASLCGAVVGMGVIAAISSRYLPSMPLFRDMVLVPPGAAAAASSEPQLRPDLAGATFALINPVLERDQALVGKPGTAMTVLRPAGKAQIGEEFVDVISDGPFISAGRPIEVVAVSGNRVIVREVS